MTKSCRLGLRTNVLELSHDVKFVEQGHEEHFVDQGRGEKVVYQRHDEQFVELDSEEQFVEGVCDGHCNHQCETVTVTTSVRQS